MNKYVKKFFLIISLTGILTFCGCFFNINDKGPAQNILSEKYGITDYSAYFNDLDPYLRQFFIQYSNDESYLGNDIGIIISLKRKNEDTDEIFEDNYAHLINAHNNFIQNNLNYFGKDINFVYSQRNPDGEVYQFSNKPSFYRLDADISELSVDNNNQLAYCLINYGKANYGFSYCPQGDYLDEVKVLGYSLYKDHTPYDFSFLNNFPNLEKIVFLDVKEYNEKDKFYYDLKKDYPSLEVYTATYSKELIKQEY